MDNVNDLTRKRELKHNLGNHQRSRRYKISSCDAKHFAQIPPIAQMLTQANAKVEANVIEISEDPKAKWKREKDVLFALYGTATPK